jgi:hypothetical protein
MDRTAHTYFLSEARYYRSIGWRDLSAMYLGLAATCREGMRLIKFQKDAA